MDFDFITQLYYGNINPNVRDMPRDSVLGKASKAVSDAEEELTNALSGACGWARGQSWLSWPGQTSGVQRIEHFIINLKRRRTDGKCLFFAVFIGQKKTID